MAESALWDVHYDRRVSDDFLKHFLKGGVASSLVEYVKNAPYPIDLQMRKNPKRKFEEHASLYVGLTSVLNVERAGDRLRLNADKAHMGRFGFSKAWTEAMGVDELRSRWRAVEDYLEGIIPTAALEHASREGAVQAAASVFSSRDRIMVDREVALHFKDTATKKRIFAEVTGKLLPAILGIAGVPGKPPSSFGGECDLLALDSTGRLLAVEVKPRSTGSIVWSGVQATIYARLLQMWLDSPPRGTDAPRTIVQGMLDQRSRLMQVRNGAWHLAETPVVVPVVAVQRGANLVYLDRMKKVQEVLLAKGHGDAALEIYEVSMAGRMERLV